MLNMRIVERLLLTLALLATTSLASAARIIIDTTPGTSFQGPFGEPGAAFFGQTFTLPLNAKYLTSFTFFVDGFDEPGPVEFEAVVRRWNGTLFQPVGPDLFRSSLVSTTPHVGLQTFVFGPLLIPLRTNAVQPPQYILLLSAVFDGVQDRGRVPQRGDDPLPGGNFVISHDGLFWFAGTSTSGRFDLAFRAEFIPEPSTGLLLASGLVGLFGLCWRLQHRSW